MINIFKHFKVNKLRLKSNEYKNKILKGKLNPSKENWLNGKKMTRRYILKMKEGEKKYFIHKLAEEWFF